MPGEEGDVNGIAWVKDGRIGVRDTKHGGKPANNSPHKDVEILVTVQSITTKAPLSY